MGKVDLKIIQILKSNGVGVLPTDTLYGLVGSAFSEKAIERIYKLKNRSQNKPFIILISKIKDLKMFGVEIKREEKATLKKYWMSPVSIILECPNLSKEMSYLKPLNNTLAFRCPNLKWLRKLLKKTGPLVAPSANPESSPPAENIEQARMYFGETVDFYVDNGELKGQPSTILKLNEDGVEVRRQGRAEINNNK
ncbi:MAG: L-threonylcarbamoyladenylate synthase [Candidatus Pacebacteria bacterium]|nr:L-threonylcarbamoyladenylate synthase [Candidatus Paceibacterota bacterium]